MVVQYMVRDNTLPGALYIDARAQNTGYRVWQNVLLVSRDERLMKPCVQFDTAVRGSHFVVSPLCWAYSSVAVLYGLCAC